MTTLPTTSQSFLSTLEVIPLSALHPSEICPICRASFQESYTESQQTINERALSLFVYLSFCLPWPLELERPVRLPCPARHVFGTARLKAWFDAVRQKQGQFPLCRSPVCTLITTDEHIVRRWHLREAEKRIKTLPLRRLIIDHRTWTHKHRIRIDVLDTDDLLVLMVGVARQLQKPKISNEPLMNVRLGVRHHDPLDIQYPVEPDGPRPEGAFNNRNIARLANAVGLVDGAFLDWLVLLLSPEAYVVYSVAFIVTWDLGSNSLSPQVVADRLIERVRQEWGQDSLRDRRLELFLELTVKAYVGRERMLTDLRYEYGVYEDAQDEVLDPDDEVFGDPGGDVDNAEDGNMGEGVAELGYIWIMASLP
ncbi:hypothetical protein K458DRAFT_419061 [Lentithecium fluviatile CBS 122367]|uniref:Uncharacterized protein n=1 Tax=Lentithecium fluviatile CBS 122367 TaxID=1168545 RepID=A0A6G1IZA1_9PLEO|nr:hypothetical protein K458DRAFT_419061 [Lentithecium fluviatile CBS 122367]